MSIKPRLEEDGLYTDNIQHWELIEKIRIYIPTILPRGGEIYIPQDLIRHLGIENHDYLDLAIRRSVLRNGKKVILNFNPMDPIKFKLARMIGNRWFLDEFLKSNVDSVEISPKKYNSFLKIINKNVEYQQKVQLHAFNFRKPNYHLWLVKKKKEGGEKHGS